MACPHDGFHEISTTYDRKHGVLVYFWACQRCGACLREAGRQEYRASFDPHGNDHFFRAAAGRGGPAGR
jgi:hypothetical protein